MLGSRPKQYYPLTIIAAMIPSATRRNATIKPETLSNWIRKGVRSATGERIFLPARRVGARWLLSEEDINAFFEKLGELNHAADRQLTAH
jgi:hypothetical protein